VRSLATFANSSYSANAWGGRQSLYCLSSDFGSDLFASYFISLMKIVVSQADQLELCDPVRGYPSQCVKLLCSGSKFVSRPHVINPTQTDDRRQVNLLGNVSIVKIRRCIFRKTERKQFEFFGTFHPNTGEWRHCLFSNLHMKSLFCFDYRNYADKKWMQFCSLI